MKEKMKIDLRTKKYTMLVIDILLNIVTLIFILFCSWDVVLDIGIKKVLLLYCFDSALVMIFLIAFEEYRPITSKGKERIVSFILSNIYSLLVVATLNLVFLENMLILKYQVLFCFVNIILLSLGIWIFYKITTNTKYFQKPRLLIIQGNDGEFGRMKRMKYGTLSYYDSWYEPMDVDNILTVEQFINKHFKEFDAICVFDNIKDDVYQMIVKKAMKLNKDLYTVPKLIDINKSSTDCARFDDLLVFYIQKYSLSLVEEFIKRTFDIFVSLLGLILASIPMILIAVAIKLTSKGPIIYKQKRLTKNKKEFDIYKFRTMIPDAEKKSGPVFAQKDDPRITKIGKILRSLRLDELPQILNMLKGDMSIVGPRPERPFFVEQFEKTIDNYDYRFVVKAGLTSLSHVYGRYSSYIEDRTRYDLLYISNYSFLLDLKIILLTSKTMFIKDASQGEDEFKCNTAEAVLKN